MLLFVISMMVDTSLQWIKDTSFKFLLPTFELHQLMQDDS